MNYPIKGFIETSFSDWPGKVASVLFLPFCNFRCPFCHNHELVLTPEKYPDVPLHAILESLRRHKGWIDGICLTGGEPTLHPWLPSLIRDLRSADGSGTPLLIKLDTNGTHPEVLQRLLRENLLDYVALDLKGPLQQDRYSAAAGIPMSSGELARVQESLRILLASRIDYELRTTVIPTLIREEEVYALARQARGAPRYTLQRFNPQETLDTRLRTLVPFDDQTFRRMQERVDGMIRPSGSSGKLPPITQ